MQNRVRVRRLNSIVISLMGWNLCHYLYNNELMIWHILNGNHKQLATGLSPQAKKKQNYVKNK